MKKLVCMAAVCLAAWNTNGAQAAGMAGQDTLVVEAPRKVIIEKQADSLRIEVRGAQNNPGYRYVYVQRRQEGDVAVESEVRGYDSDFNFNIPFTRYAQRKHRRKSFEPHWSGVGFGFCDVAKSGKGGLNGPEGVSTHMSDSYELFWNITSFSHAFGHSGWGLVSGIGIDWRNFRMDKEYRFYKDGKNVQVGLYEEGAEPRFSRLKVFSITIPFLLEWQTLSGGRFFANAGPVVNINAYGSLKTRYSVDGEKRKEESESIKQMPLTVDFMGQVGYGCLGVYLKYSPFRLLQTDYAPDIRPLTCGLILQF